MYDYEAPRGHALLLLLSAGMSPKTLVALGYPRATVYRWNKNYRLSIKRLRKDLERKVSSLSQSKENNQIP